MDSLASKPKAWMGRRHGQALFLFIALTVAYLQRVNVSVGLVAMTDTTSELDYPILNYTTSQKGRISSVFYYGYMINGPIAGIICDKYNAVKLLSIIGGLFCGLLTLVIPFVATEISGIWLLCAIRVVQGLAQAFICPAINSVLAKWIIPQERESFTWVYLGSQLGTIIMSILGGLLAISPGGWPSIYYVSGFCSVILGIFGIFYGSNSPRTDRRISEEERNYILSNLNEKTGEKLVIPWKSLVKSKPLMILIMVHFCNNWGFFTLLTLLPTYIHGVYQFKINANGFLSALPYIGMLISGLIVSAIADKVTVRRGVNFSRKFWNSIGYFGPAIALLTLSIFTTKATGAVTLLTIATSTNAAMISGFMCTHMDLSPNMSGILMGITNGLANLASIIAPELATLIVKDETNVSQWQTVFMIAAGIYVIGNTIFVIFGSTSLQPWNDCAKYPTSDEKRTGCPSAVDIPSTSFPPKHRHKIQSIEDSEMMVIPQSLRTM